MSNHIHFVVTDVDGLLPKFMRDFCREASKALSAELGLWGGFWDARKYSRVELLDDQRIIEAVAYVLANPVSSRLVRRAVRWPGLTSVNLKFDQTIRASRPATRYYASSTQPLVAEMEFRVPRGMDPIEFRSSVLREVRRLEQVALKKYSDADRKFVGEKTVLEQDPYDCAASFEKRRGLDPTFASSDRWARAEAAQRKREWEAEYEAARDAFRHGERDVIFPAGTWWMVEYFNCRVEPYAAAA
jgi:hypothetical protein